MPALARRWSLSAVKPGLLLGARLSAGGIDHGDAWLAAANKTDLRESLLCLPDWLSRAEPWFARFNDLGAIAAAYAEREALTVPAEVMWTHQVMAANYGFLLAELGQRAAALASLQVAELKMALPVYYDREGQMHHAARKGARQIRPGHDDLNRLVDVRIALAALRA